MRAIPLAVSAVTQVALTTLCPSATPTTFALCDLVAYLVLYTRLPRVGMLRGEMPLENTSTQENSGNNDACKTG